MRQYGEFKPRLKKTHTAIFKASNDTDCCYKYYASLFKTSIIEGSLDGSVG